MGVHSIGDSNPDRPNEKFESYLCAIPSHNLLVSCNQENYQKAVSHHNYQAIKHRMHAKAGHHLRQETNNPNCTFKRVNKYFAAILTIGCSWLASAISNDTQQNAQPRPILMYHRSLCLVRPIRVENIRMLSLQLSGSRTRITRIIIRWSLAMHWKAPQGISTDLCRWKDS